MAHRLLHQCLHDGCHGDDQPNPLVSDGERLEGGLLVSHHRREQVVDERDIGEEDVLVGETGTRCRSKGGGGGGGGTALESNLDGWVHDP